MPSKKPFVRRFGQVDFDSMLALQGAAADDADIFVTRRGEFGANQTLTRAQIIAGAGVVPDPLLLGDGVVGAPSYSFTSNPTTGTFLAAAGELGFTANGIEVARMIEAAGAVQFVVPQNNNAAFPGIAFGDGDSGFHEFFDDRLALTLGGVNFVLFDGSVTQMRVIGDVIADNGASYGLFNDTASSTVPTIVPRNSNPTTGLGSAVQDQMNLIAGGLTCMSVSEVAGARRIGFYEGSPIALQTGVAVTTAAVHAALVALRLITA